MARIVRVLPDAPSEVWAVLTTPETYPLWLVGCQAIRAVDEGWPTVGTSFHHRVGLFGPVTVADHTTVCEVEDGQRLVLEVRARPLGRGRVTFTVGPEPGGGGTRLTMEEVPLGVIAPLQPALDPVTSRRNHQSLDRMAQYLEANRRLHESAPTG